MAKKFGDVIDLNEMKEAETTRATIAKGVQQLFIENKDELLSTFRSLDMGTTDKSGYVSQRTFREVMLNLGIAIEAAIFASPGVWVETREVVDVVDVRTGLKRKGPMKETLQWKQDRPVQDGPVEYERFVLQCTQPDGESAVAEATQATARDANELYRLWQLVCTHQRQLLQEFIMLDKIKTGYVDAADFHKALYPLSLAKPCSSPCILEQLIAWVQWALEASSSDAKLIVRNIPLQAGCGSIDYRRWIVEFCKDPHLDWQAYLNVSLLASGDRELQLCQAEEDIRASKLRMAREEQEMRHMDWARRHEHARHLAAIVVPNLKKGDVVTQPQDAPPRTEMY